MALEPPPTQAQIGVRMVDAVPVLELLLGFLADDLLEVAHHGRERVWTRGGAEQVVRVLDGLVTQSRRASLHGILQRCRLPP